MRRTVESTSQSFLLRVPPQGRAAHTAGRAAGLQVTGRRGGDLLRRAARLDRFDRYQDIEIATVATRTGGCAVCSTRASTPSPKAERGSIIEAIPSGMVAIGNRPGCRLTICVHGGVAERYLDVGPASHEGGLRSAAPRSRKVWSGDPVDPPLTRMGPSKPRPSGAGAATSAARTKTSCAIAPDLVGVRDGGPIGCQSIERRAPGWEDRGPAPLGVGRAALWKSGNRV